MKKNVSEKIRKLVITGALGGLAVFLGISRLGFFPWFSGASITVLHVPAIIGAILEGPIVGTGIGAIFGIFSLIQANIAPLSPIDIAFRNPLVSVLPRILFPLATWGIWYFISKWKRTPAIIIASIGGTLIHTVLVLTTLVLTNGSGILTGGVSGVTIWAVISAIFVANGIPEAIIAAVLSTLIISAWIGVSNSKKKSKLSQEIDSEN
ncbi:MAG TPA: ECF transporter S component [Treponemataceae bacterium]|nr:ECF transporter S component [Treponemataceae bacterium]